MKPFWCAQALALALLECLQLCCSQGRNSPPQEASLEEALSKVVSRWAGIELAVVLYKDTKDVYVLGALDDIQARSASCGRPHLRTRSRAFGCSSDLGGQEGGLEGLPLFVPSAGSSPPNMSCNLPTAGRLRRPPSRTAWWPCRPSSPAALSPAYGPRWSAWSTSWSASRTPSTSGSRCGRDGLQQALCCLLN
jgi:hypothetical protein